MKVTTVLPTYNEKQTINEIISGLKDSFAGSDIELKFVVVDDNSQDGTSDILKKLAENDANIHLVSRPSKMGLGSAYIDAFRWILNNALQPDIVIQMDADLSHPPAIARNMVDVITNDGFDVVIASRYHNTGSVKNWPFYRKIISKGANALARSVLRVQVRDMTSGYRAFRINVVEELLSRKLSSKGYEYQIESLYVMSKLGIRMHEIPFVFHNRVYGKSKLRTNDIIQFAKTIVKLRLRPPLPIMTSDAKQPQQQPQQQRQQHMHSSEMT